MYVMHAYILQLPNPSRQERAWGLLTFPAWFSDTRILRNSVPWGLSGNEGGQHGEGRLAGWKGWDTMWGAMPCLQVGACLPRLAGRTAVGDFHKRERGDLAIPFLYFKVGGREWSSTVCTFLG
jgi:hypothetical protein